MTVAMRVRDRDTLRAYVRLMRLSERGLAARAGVGHATVNHLLSGRRETCSPETAQAIEKVLGCAGGVFFEPVRRTTTAPGKGLAPARRR
ncbi:helix-turn-helix transcriptional regulator [Jatrophihabitans sp.]|uniref:helix-turn-helix domain-containing protein n=1 Tax=Jatrophihabitans sp. TaxID=1932789 RepID=UPI0030C6E632|nr:helix-turn-helix protein [Jatrophihabitans sp.]